MTTKQKGKTVKIEDDLHADVKKELQAEGISIKFLVNKLLREWLKNKIELK
jgi:hypothetical protein